jgi:hypothetical protein
MWPTLFPPRTILCLTGLRGERRVGYLRPSSASDPPGIGNDRAKQERLVAPEPSEIELRSTIGARP